MNKRVKIDLKPKRETYDIDIGRGFIGGASPLDLQAPSGGCAIVSNRKVYGLYGEQLRAKLLDAGIDAVVHLIGDGERFKTLRTVEGIARILAENRIGRDGWVIALGGGVVGDAAGFAASVHLRGIRFIQIPTTLLAMLDSSVGGKTGVNTTFGKNLLGTFYQPSRVLIDIDVLDTLPEREITAGLCEAVKHGALAGPKLFQRTVKTIEGRAGRGRFSETDGLTDFIADNVRFKASVVSGDPKEAQDGTRSNSRKILNFGHTFAHALEKATNYRVYKHGEAVGYGIMFAAELSKKLDMLHNDVVESLNDVVHRAGILPPISNIRPDDVIDAFRFDKKVAGHDLQWILLRGIGKPVIVPQSEIPQKLLRSVLKDFLQSRSNS